MIRCPGRVEEIFTRLLIQSGKEIDNYFARRLGPQHVLRRNKAEMLVIHSNSLIWFRSIFSSDKAESGNKSDRGRKLVRWGREKMRKEKKTKEHQEVQPDRN